MSDGRQTAQIRVGIFAGSFDPIHDGHIETALSSAKYLELQKVYFMVESEPWGNKSPESIDHRSKMIEIAIADLPQLGQLKLDDKQFSIEKTLKKIEKQFTNFEIYFIFGADVFMKMSKDTWPHLNQLLNHYIVVFERGNIKEDRIQDHAKRLGVVTAIFPEINKHSSSDVRMYPHKKEIWIPKSVADYIDKNNLYS